MGKCDLKTGDRVGPYRLLGRIGRGGMAEVFKARRDDGIAARPVALKLMHARWAGHESLVHRFRSEREILSTLDHPGIARLLDGGVTPDGAQYVAMELVEGVTLDQYSRNVPLPAKLDLFLQLCAAVHYAHQHLVIHRDLKPNNVLVTSEGVVKLLDFGIAKLLRAQTMPGELPETRPADRLATPEYAAPEQLRGEISSTATDVYGLGVLLYFLLSGRLPFDLRDRDWAESERIVCTEEPAPLAVQLVPADLRAIAAMALRKDPTARYSSVAALADDVRRHLAHHPVHARRGGWLYPAQRFLRRHAAASALAAALVLVLAGGAAALIELNRRVVEERDAARASSYFLADLFETADPQAGRRPMRDVLDEGARRVHTRLQHQPRVQAAMAEKIGDVYRQLALNTEAMPLARLALERYEQLDGPQSLDAARNMIRVADLLRESQHYAEAESLSRRSGEIRRRGRGPRHIDVADSLNMLGIVTQYQGKAHEAEQAFREAVAIRRAGDPGSTLLALSLGNLGNVLRDSGDWTGAAALFREALAIRRKVWGPEHPRVAFSLGQLSQVAFLQNDAAEAVRAGEESVAILRRTLPARHPDIVRGLQHYGNALRLAKRYPEAERALREALATATGARGQAAPETIAVGAALGMVLQETGRGQEAALLLRRNVESRRKHLGARSLLLATALEELAQNRQRMNGASEARALLTEALSIRESAQGAQHQEAQRVAASLQQLAQVASAAQQGSR